MTPSASARWSLAALVVVVALVVAIWPRGDDATSPSSFQDLRDAQGTSAPAAASDAELAPVRDAAALQPCPDLGEAAPADSVLAGVSATCLATGAPVDLAASLAGRPALINLWAYWCEPCAEELPYLQQYAERAGEAITVITAHEDPREGNALARLADYDVQLPGVQTGTGRIAAAVGAPPVLPVSVLVAADGSIARVLPQPFRSVEDVADAVRTNLGVDA